MKIVEFRIVMPFSMDEYEKGLRYTLAKAARLETGTGEGVEILKQEPFTNAQGTGIFTHKVVHLHSRLPRWVLALLPSDVLTFEEKVWNQFPHIHAEYWSPYLDDKIKFSVDTIIKGDNGCSDNVHGLEGKQLAKRKVEYIDIAEDEKAGAAVDREDPTTFQSQATGRGPLRSGWQENAQPVCCAYRLATININLFGIQRKVEKLIQKQALRHEYYKCHRQMFCWADEWYNLSHDGISGYEAQTKASLYRILHGVVEPPGLLQTGGMFGSDAGESQGGMASGFGDMYGNNEVGMKATSIGWAEAYSPGTDPMGDQETAGWYPEHYSKTTVDLWQEPKIAPPEITRQLARTGEVRGAFGKSDWSLAKARGSCVKSSLKFSEAEENIQAAQRLLAEAQKKMAQLQELPAIAGYLDGSQPSQSSQFI